MFNWRNTYLFSIAVRFFLALTNSYIHPDEHFQNFEVLTSSILNYTTSIPWEFTSENPARSMGPLYLIYGPILYLVRITGSTFTPLQIWYIMRLQFLVLTWVFTDFLVYRMLPTRPERIKGIFFILTSYVTLTYQQHCFSNSIETILVLLAVYLVDEMRFFTNEHRRTLVSSYFVLGAVVALGIFNRITFPTFLILPLIFVFNHLRYSNHKLRAILMGCLGFVIPTVSFIVLDSTYFGQENTGMLILQDPFGDLSKYIITPWNSLKYNSSTQNLAKHGIHPYYTHLLVNFPQLVGPTGLMFLFYKGNKYLRATPFLSLVSGLLFLSAVPHQELRFLTPLVPLACCCFDLEKFQPVISEKNGTPKKTSPMIVSTLMFLWYAFNTILSILMGVLHQGGVIPVLDHFHTSPSLLSNDGTSAQIWWRTYSPPSWILGNKNNTLSIITSTSESPTPVDLDTKRSQLLIDTMGSDFEYVQGLVNELQESGVSRIYLITPIASYLTSVSEPAKYRSVWNYTLHLDLDHLDFGNLKSLTPGIGVYELL